MESQISVEELRKLLFELDDSITVGELRQKLFDEKNQKSLIDRRFCFSLQNEIISSRK